MARVIGSYFDHSPVCASRNVGNPLSADMPAPVSTVTERAFDAAAISSSGTSVMSLSYYGFDPRSTDLKARSPLPTME
ncbi:Uncharacterised protein [Mycobacteroides abscessus]|nr:Uncharacterised protein [Mycobacteroides abscessus]SHV35624.1 Uncharacterised protein [Mycobacteroides abscessus subsp. abscessus]SKU59415.1 Uncharacterised protein [Mycobacteroides abscessus subsp. abscessus]SKV49671.1 Uncharacterised protein [Mycobacteroides abscessus subsp. abscessus]